MSKIKDVCDKVMGLHLLSSVTKVVHYTTQSYHTHELADRLCHTIMSFADSFAESYFGIYGKPNPSDVSMNQTGLNEYRDIKSIVDKAREICTELRQLISDDDSGLVSRIDDLDNNLANISYLAMLKESKSSLQLNMSAVRKMVSETFRRMVNENGGWDDSFASSFNGSGYEPEVNPYNNVGVEEPESGTYNGKDLVKRSKVVADLPGFRIEKCEGEYGDFYRLKGGGSRTLFNNHERFCPANHGIYKVIVGNAKVIYHFDTDKGKIVKTERLRS